MSAALSVREYLRGALYGPKLTARAPDAGRPFGNTGNREPVRESVKEAVRMAWAGKERVGFMKRTHLMVTAYGWSLLS